MAEELDLNKQVTVDFSYLENNDVTLSPNNPNLPALQEGGEIVTKKRKTKKKKEDTEVVEEKAIDAYEENLNALKGAIIQYDILANDFKNDLDMVRSSRTMKGKFHYAAELGQTLNSILSNKVAAIKELNNTVKNAQEFDYKVKKDKQALAQGDDDRRLMDMYNAFIGAPVSTGGRSILGPTESQMTIIDSVPQYMPEDAGYQNYLNNMSPEQNLMLYENDPNIKQVVTYNQVTGEKHFQVMNTATGQIVPNVSHHDDSFLEGVTIDPNRMIARNTNLNESYPLVIVNDDSNMNGF